jgi:hypothetical protein
MKRVPPDLDRLMWTLVEDGDPRAVEEFGQRFPELRPELGKRLAVMRDLRGARSSLGRRGTPPHFEPPLPGEGSRLKPAWAGAALFVLAVAAFASYALTRTMIATPRANPQAPPTQPADSGSQNDFVHQPLPKPNSTEPPQPDETTRVPGPYQQKFSLKIDRAPLLDAIQTVAQRSGMQVQIAPGMDNPDVAVEYTEMTGMEILVDMGKQMGFTSFYEGDGNVLILPAVDPKRVSEPSKANGTTQVVEDTDNAPKPAKSAPPKK